MTKKTNKVEAPARKPFSVGLTDVERDIINLAASKAKTLPSRYVREVALNAAKRQLAKKGGE